MKASRLISCAIVCLMATTGITASQPERVREQTIMSYNVKSGMGMDRKRDYGRTAAVIAAESPDVVAIQELDSMTNRSGRRYVLGELAELTGMKAYFAPAIDYDGGKYGIGLLTKEEPVDVRRYALPGREEERAMIVAEFPGYFFACTHLSLTADDRLASAEIIRRLSVESSKPFFIAGDFNAEPDSEVIGLLRQDFEILTPVDELTFPADTPDRTLDYIMVDKSGARMVKKVSSGVVEAPMASDHRPVVVHVVI